MISVPNEIRPFSQHRFLGRLSLHGGTPPSQYIFYNHVTDYYYYGQDGKYFLSMRDTLTAYLQDILHYDVIVYYNASEGLTFPNSNIEQSYREIVVQHEARTSGPPLERSYGEEIDAPATVRSLPNYVSNPGLIPLFNRFGMVLRQPHAEPGQSVRVAIILERIQNLITNSSNDDHELLDQIQSWTSLTNNNVALLIADIARLDELPPALVGTHRSGISLINVGLPNFDEVNKLFVAAERGWLTRWFDESNQNHRPVKIQDDQRRDLIARLDGYDALTIRGYFKQCVNRDEPLLNMRKLRQIISTRRDIWPDLLEESRLQRVEQGLRNRVLGQDPALEQIFLKLRAVRDDLEYQLETGRIEERLLAYFFFAGPTGVGKTEVFRALADEFKEIRTRKFNMPEYKGEHSVSRFFGAPPGYVGYGRGELGEFLLENPAAIVLFDEFEKADKNIWKNFLTMLEGSLTTGDGVRVDLSQVIFIFTSNAGAADLQPIEPQMTRGEQENLRNQNLLTIQRALRQADAPPELIGRLLASIIAFNHMTEPVIIEIIWRNLKKLARQLEVEKFHSSIEDFLRDEYTRKGKLGARMIDQAINLVLKAEINRFPRPRRIIFKDKDGLTQHAQNELAIISLYCRHETTKTTTKHWHIQVDATNEHTLYKSVRPTISVVLLFDTNRRYCGYCTAFTVSEHGYLVTKHAAIAGYTNLVALYGTEQQRVELTLVGASTFDDLAILRPTEQLSEVVPYLLLANSGTAEEGTDIAVFGIPSLTYDDDERVTLQWSDNKRTGRITTRRESDNLFLFNDLYVQPGEYGSPLIRCDNGHIIGMVLGRQNSTNTAYALTSNIIQYYLREVGAVQPLLQLDK